MTTNYLQYPYSQGLIFYYQVLEIQFPFLVKHCIQSSLQSPTNHHFFPRYATPGLDLTDLSFLLGLSTASQFLQVPIFIS
jgi:hypothetical protein